MTTVVRDFDNRGSRRFRGRQGWRRFANVESSDGNSICWEDISAFHKLFVADGGGKKAVLSDLPRECAILISFLGARGSIIEL